MICKYKIISFKAGLFVKEKTQNETDFLKENRRIVETEYWKIEKLINKRRIEQPTNQWCSLTLQVIDLAYN